MQYFFIFIIGWYLSVFLLIYINYKLIVKDYIKADIRVMNAQIKARNAAFEWQKEQFYF